MATPPAQGGSATAQAPADSAVREKSSFNDGWRFMRNDPEDAGGELAYDRIKPWILATGSELISVAAARSARPKDEPGATVSYVQPDFDDSGWRRVELPHDWGIEGPFAQDLPSETGKLPWQGVGWYRKRFALPESDRDRRIYLDLDGAMAYSEVWLNGHFVGGWPYGYTSYRLDLTPSAKFGGENVVVVRLYNPDDSTRWYPGSGIYRNTWLVKTSPLHIAHWGVWVTTPIVTPEKAIVKINMHVQCDTIRAPARLTLETSVFELSANGTPSALPVASGPSVEFEIDPARSSGAVRTQRVDVANPRLWDLATPNRYLAVTVLKQDGIIVDRYEESFGIRTIRFDPDQGFMLNGRIVKLKGVCLHHDLGALGSAINTRALERRIEILQEMGCNAIRMSHNPPAPELLDLCDRKGMLVMDEAFDGWRRGKKEVDGTTEAAGPMHYKDYARIFDDWHERDMRALVRRDRNHPSVVMWSIGNEVKELGSNDGWEIGVRLAGIVREEDRTRPVTLGSDSRTGPFSGFQHVVDVFGYNYKPDEYAKFHYAHPEIPVFSSESASTVSSRGEYFFPVEEGDSRGQADYQVSSYDICAGFWGNLLDAEWRGLDENPYTLGEFVWTGFDYLGETWPYYRDKQTELLDYTDPTERARAQQELRELGRIRVPARSSYFGILDLAGFRKDRFYLYQSRWRPELPMAHIVPHWNWPERVGQVTPVYVYSSGDEAELFLNGRSLGRTRRGPLEYRFRWDDVIYEPGELRVVTYKEGLKWAETVTKTTGPAAKLLLAPDRVAIRCDGQDLSFITVTVADRDNLLVPRSKNLVRFSIKGPGKIVAVDNGDPTSFEPFQASQRTAFNGLAQVIIRALPGESGTITLQAESDGLAPAEVRLTASGQ